MLVVNGTCTHGCPKSAYELFGSPGWSLSRFPQHEATRNISTPPLDGMLVHCRVTPSIKSAETHLYIWVERGTVGVSVLPMNTPQYPRPGLEPGPLDLESSTLTMRPLHLPPNIIWHNNYNKYFWQYYNTYNHVTILIQQFRCGTITEVKRYWQIHLKEYFLLLCIGSYKKSVWFE